MIEAPRISDEQQKQLRYEFVKMIEEYDDQEQLAEFKREWDGTVNFKMLDDHSVLATVKGDEKLPPDLKQRSRELLNRFNRQNL